MKASEKMMKKMVKNCASVTLVCTMAVWALAGCNLLGLPQGGGSGDESPGEEEYLTIEEIEKIALEISEAKANIGRRDLWIKGYVAGGDLSAKNIKFEGPFTSATNLAIAPYPFCDQRDSCLSVSLPQGPLRNALNLVTNEEIMQWKIYVHGEIVVSYFGLVGIKPLDDYRLESY